MDVAQKVFVRVRDPTINLYTYILLLCSSKKKVQLLLTPVAFYYARAKLCHLASGKRGIGHFVNKRVSNS